MNANGFWIGIGGSPAGVRSKPQRAGTQIPTSSAPRVSDSNGLHSKPTSQGFSVSQKGRQWFSTSLGPARQPLPSTHSSNVRQTSPSGVEP